MKYIIGLCLLAVAISQQIPPIPSSPDGLAYGPDVTTNYTLDVFWDHLCPYSAAAYSGLFTFFYNTPWLRMVIHIFPLPYHYYAFDVGTAGRFIQLNYAPSFFTEYLSFMFKNQNKYLSNAQSWDQPTLFQNLAADTSTATGADPGLVLAGLNDPSVFNSLRLSAKYALINGIVGTPVYMLNGVLVPELTGFNTTQQWEDFFDSLDSYTNF